MRASDRAELAGAKSIQALPAEITALRTEIPACFTKRFRPVNCCRIIDNTLI
jgi:hypothetical protein